MLVKLFEYIFLGILQGITEPIPVSSSGHLLILQTILEKFNQSINIDFTTLATITNLGSLIAITILFWNDIIRICALSRERYVAGCFHFCSFSVHQRSHLAPKQHPWHLARNRMAHSFHLWHKRLYTHQQYGSNPSRYRNGISSTMDSSHCLLLYNMPCLSGTNHCNSQACHP